MGPISAISKSYFPINIMVYQIQLILLYKIIIIILAICHVIIGIVAATQGFREEQLIRQLQLPKYFDDSQYIEDNTILQSSYFPFILAASHIFFLALPIFIMPFFNIILSIISCYNYSSTISHIVKIKNNFHDWFHDGSKIAQENGHKFESLFLLDLFKELDHVFHVNFGVMIAGLIALILTILVNFWLIYWYHPRVQKSLSKENVFAISEE